MGRRVLVVDDEASSRDLYAHVLREAGYDVACAASAEEALEALCSRPPDMVVSDVRMPGASGIELLREARRSLAELPFLLVTAYSNVRDAVTSLKLGAVDYLEKPVDLDELLAAVSDALGPGAGPGPADVPPESLGGIVAESPAMKALLRDAYRVAASDATVLLTGESGTGKDVLAGFIHRNSPRRSARFVAINCAAIPAAVLTSELFGHEKGAFTGADAPRAGHFREARGGTIFLDEIGEMQPGVQATLLRVIETKTVTPLGSSREEPVDFRLIAATNADLAEAVAGGRFREDLYYRLNVIHLELPPLRERPEDIEPLCRRFLRESGPGKRLSPAAARLLRTYRWPGNVRELRNAIERSSLLTNSEVILPEHLPPAIRQAAQEGGEPAGPAPVRTLRESERDAIERALRETGGNRTRAARLLGMSRRALIYKIKRFGLGQPR